MNTTEKNILIAEFLCTTQKTKDLDDCYILNGKAYHIEDLNFHSSWEWLMQVVEKIESIGGTQIFINGISCEIIFKGIVISKHSNTKIESVYNACVEFILWFNENKK